TISAGPSRRRISPSCCARTQERWCPADAVRSALLRLDSRLSENPSVLRVIALQDRRERLRRPARDLEAAVGESLTDIGLAQHRLDLPVQPHHDLARRRGG